MPEQREENSVLFSLKELRRMEDDRIRKEQEDRRAREDAERRAREDADRRVQEEAERQRREAEERVRRTEEERLAREREEQMRLAEAERRARVEGEMRLNEERMRLEVQAKKHAKSPIGPIIGAIVVLLVIGGGVIWKLRADHVAALQAAELEKQRVAEESRRREEAFRIDFERKFKTMQSELETAKTEEEKRQIQLRMERERQRELDRRQRSPVRSRSDDGPAKPAAPKIKRPANVDDDPLKGLKL